MTQIQQFAIILYPLKINTYKSLEGLAGAWKADQPSKTFLKWMKMAQLVEKLSKIICFFTAIVLLDLIPILDHASLGMIFMQRLKALLPLISRRILKNDGVANLKIWSHNYSRSRKMNLFWMLLLYMKSMKVVPGICNYFAQLLQILAFLILKGMHVFTRKVVAW